jgi:hypothetical protein
MRRDKPAYARAGKIEVLRRQETNKQGRAVASGSPLTGESQWMRQTRNRRGKLPGQTAEVRAYLPNESEVVGGSVLASPESWPSLFCLARMWLDRLFDSWTFGVGVRYQLMLRSRSLVDTLLRPTVVVAAIALAECTPGGTASTGTSGSIGSFVSNLFGSKTGDQTPVAQNAAPIEASAPKSKPATPKPKHSAVAAAGAKKPANTKTRIAIVPKSSPQRPPSAEPQSTPESTPESTTTPLLSGAAPTLPVGSFDNRFGPWR